jgi:phosphotransferase system enzyme I (PtsI)
MNDRQLNPGLNGNICTATVTLTNKIGLHARPAIQLTKLAKRFSSQILIRTASDSPWIDAKSIVQVMAAKAPRGTRLEIAVNGENAREALQRLVDLIQDNFGEKPADAPEFAAETGHIASRGIAIGKAVFLQQRIHDERPVDTIEVESRLLHDSIRSVQTALGSLIDEADEDIADVLAFQLALIRDKTLIDPALTAIAAGNSAQSAWAQTIDEQLRHYEESGNAYFRGRRSDLADLKQQVLNQMHGEMSSLPTLSEDTIIVADDLAPSDFAMLDRRYCKGIALKKGSLNSHVALLARSRGIPMLVGLQSTAEIAASTMILDAIEGRLISAPPREVIQDFRRRMANEVRQIKAQQKYLTVKPTLPTGERIYVGINVGSLEDLKQVSSDHCDGIGLVRTEFLFTNASGMPDEDAQFEVYKKLVEWAGDKPVIVRTLDAGGDKPIVGLTEKKESNPFLGVRGIRLSMLNEDIFRIQLRALLRASAFGNLRIMLPMVTIPQELATVKKLLQETLQQLRRHDPKLERPPLGIMVEVPAAAMCIEDFDADFFSIGSNDLIQYVTACDRGEPQIAHLYRGANRAVFDLIRKTIDCGRSAGKPVSLCGDMAAQPDYIDALVDLGLRHFSVSPADLARVKATLCGHNERKFDNE